MKDHLLQFPIGHCWARHMISKREVWAFRVLIWGIGFLLHKIPQHHCYWVLVFITLLPLSRLRVQQSRDSFFFLPVHEFTTLAILIHSPHLILSSPLCALRQVWNPRFEASNWKAHGQAFT
jgi:hypothetical protein